MATKYACFAGGMRCSVQCIICEITKNVYTEVIIILYILGGTFYYMYEYSVVMHIYINKFVGIYETVEPARRGGATIIIIISTVSMGNYNTAIIITRTHH